MDGINRAGREIERELHGWIKDGIALREFRSFSLIVANLTDEEYSKFQAAHITYSGATGTGKVKGYEPYGPYIATYLSELLHVIDALGWDHTTLDRDDTQYILRKRADDVRS